jgi:hypothetical protein
MGMMIQTKKNNKKWVCGEEEMGMLRRRNGYCDFKKEGLRVFLHLGNFECVQG